MFFPFSRLRCSVCSTWPPCMQGFGGQSVAQTLTLRCNCQLVFTDAMAAGYASTDAAETSAKYSETMPLECLSAASPYNIA